MNSERVRRTINQTIRNQNLNIVKKYIQEAACYHEWQSYGHGYKCSHCGHYTGQNTNVNNLIKKLHP